MRIRAFITIGAVSLATMALMPHTAQAVTIGKYGSECVTTYDPNTNCPTISGANIPNCCIETNNFQSKMSGYGYAAQGNYELTSVYDSDSIDGDVVSGGHDNEYTDVPNQDIEYYSMHGSCGNYPHGLPKCTSGSCAGASGSCTNNTECQGYVSSPPSGNPTGMTWACDTVSSTCAGYVPGNTNYDREMFTCSSDSTFSNIVDLTTQMYFGEYPGIAFGSAGTNGSDHFVAFDTSCPFALPFIVPMNINIFTGLHFSLGFSTAPSGDTGDSEVRAEYFAMRLHEGETVATAWADASVDDDAEDTCGDGGLCTIALTCDTSSEASWRIANETLTSGPDRTAAPAYCYWSYSCC